METSSTTKVSGSRYRYRTGNTLSGWMTSDELKTHATEGRIKMDSGIQKIGNEEWIPASKVAALWATAANSAAATGANSGANPGDSGAHHDAHDSRAGSTVGMHTSAVSAGGSSAGNGGNGNGHGHAHGERTAPVAGGGAIHPSRIGESIQHLLQRAVLSHVTICAPELETPQTVMLAGVTNHDVAFEFEGSGSVVYIPYSRLRSVTVPRSYAHTSGKIRAAAELLVIEVEHIPTAILQSVGQAAQASQPAR